MGSTGSDYFILTLQNGFTHLGAVRGEDEKPTDEDGVPRQRDKVARLFEDHFYYKECDDKRCKRQDQTPAQTNKHNSG